MRVAVVDIGTNSTRLLVADVARTARCRARARVDGDAAGRGSGGERAARRRAAGRGCSPRSTAYAAADRRAPLRGRHRGAHLRGPGRRQRRRVHGRRARALRAGRADAERGRGGARTFPGATAVRRARTAELVLVIDIGGGSTELVTGRARRLGFHVSTQVGVVRHTERHLHADPPAAGELAALTADVRAELRRAVPPHARARMSRRRSPWPARRRRAPRWTLGARALRRRAASRATCSTRAAGIPARAARGDPGVERRHVRGLHPDRAPTIVAGVRHPAGGARRCSVSARSRCPSATSSGAWRSSPTRPRGPDGPDSGRSFDREP